MGHLADHARRELEILGEEPEVIDKLIQMVDIFASMGHSGFSAAHFAQVIKRLLDYEPLSPLTDNPDEWNLIDEETAGCDDLWQSTRCPSAFSRDGGKIYYRLDDLALQGKRVNKRTKPYKPQEG